MKKLNFKFKFNRIDKLVFLPNPYRDWLMVLLCFALLLIFLSVFHFWIYLNLQSREGDITKITTPSLNEELIIEAVGIIKVKESKFNSL